MKDSVKEYYGQILQHSKDLQTNACCTDSDMSEALRKVLANIHDAWSTPGEPCARGAACSPTSSE